MPSFAATAAFTISVLFPAVQAGGNAIIRNKCAFEVAVWPVDISRNPPQPIIVPPGQSYSEPYHTPASGGVSIKVANHVTPGGPVSQLEYTVTPDGLFYDVSNIDCKGNACPFQPHGMNLFSGAGCPTVNCEAGAPICTGAYNEPDDVRTLACTVPNPDTVLELCTQKAGNKRDSALEVDETLDAPYERRDNHGPQDAPALLPREATDGLPKSRRGAGQVAAEITSKLRKRENWIVKVKANPVPQRRAAEAEDIEYPNSQPNVAPRHPHARPNVPT